MIAKAMAKTWPKLRSDPISISWCFPGGSIIGLENSSWTAYPGAVDYRQHRWLSHAAHRGPEHQTFARRGLDNALAARDFQSTARSESVRRNSAINTAGLR